MPNIHQAKAELKAGNREAAREIINAILLDNPEHIEALELQLETVETAQEFEDVKQRLSVARRSALPNDDLLNTRSELFTTATPQRDYFVRAILNLVVYIIGTWPL